MPGFRGVVVAVAAGLAVVGLSATVRAGRAHASGDVRPFADYEDTGYVFMAAFDAYGAGPAKREIAAHLPEGVTLVLYGFDGGPGARASALADYGRYLPADRLQYLVFALAPNMFWSRDALPVPLLDGSGRLHLADAKYWGRFEPDEDLAALFGAGLRALALPFEGGNLMANHRGDCYIVESPSTRRIADAVFTDVYGCRSLARLPKRGGIGHIDERARFVDAGTVLTDTPEYAAAFRGRGYRVVELARPSDDRQSYVNALVVNGTAFVPQFSRPEDAAALEVYRALGYRVRGLDARTLVRKGRGAFHCLAVNYPRVPLGAAR